MSETATTGSLVSAGQPQAGDFKLPGQAQTAAAGAGNEGAGETGNTGNSNEGSGAGENGNEGENGNTGATTNDQLIAMLKEQGIEIGEDGIEGLKQKLNGAGATNTTSAETPEQIQAKEAAFERRMLDHYLENGGTAEQFVQLKAIASADLRQLSEEQLRIELKAEGFNEDEIQTILVERYYQINPEELEQRDDETEEEFDARKALVQKKIAFGSKKLENKSAYIKKQAGDALNEIREAIKLQDLLVQKETEFSSKVDEVATELPRKLTFQLGQVNDKDEAPIDYEVKPELIAEVAAVLKDPQQRKQFLYNEDGSLNLKNIMDMMLRSKVLESSVKASLIEGGNRRVAEFEKVFPGRTAKDIGVGSGNGQTQNGTGKLVSAGKPTAARRN